MSRGSFSFLTVPKEIANVQNGCGIIVPEFKQMIQRVLKNKGMYFSNKMTEFNLVQQKSKMEMVTSSTALLGAVLDGEASGAAKRNGGSSMDSRTPYPCGQREGNSRTTGDL